MTGPARRVILHGRRRKIGPPVDVLECGHELPIRHGAAWRTCPECAAEKAAQQQPLFDPARED